RLGHARGPGGLRPGFFGARPARTAPELFLALMLQACAPPIMAAPAFAALMGLEAALSLATLVLCMAATPLSAAAFAQIFVGSALSLSPVALGLQLPLILAGSALGAAAI